MGQGSEESGTGVFERVKSVVEEVLKSKEDLITEQARIKEDLGADSLDTVTLLMALEDEFKGSISDEDAEKLNTVGDVVRYIETKMAYS